MIKYFIHLSNPICNGLVAEAFEASRKLHLENKRSWYRNIASVKLPELLNTTPKYE
jgi:hypothetical protein